MTTPPRARQDAAADGAPGRWRSAGRERDRFVALHRVSTLLAQRRRTDDVLRDALQSAVSLVEGDAGAIHRWLPEQGVLRCVVAHGRHEAIIRPEIDPSEGLTGQSFREQVSIVENDYASSPSATSWSREAGLRTAITVPISHGVDRIGVLSVGSYDVDRRFDLEDANLLELFAAMIAVALENAELNAELESRLTRIRTLNRLTRLVSTSLDLDHVLPRIAQAAAELTGAVFATFWLADSAQRALRLGGSSDARIEADLGRREMPFGQGAAGWVAQQREALTIDDVYADGRSLNLDWWQRQRMRSSLTLPVLHGHTLLAVLSLNGREPFRLAAPDRDMLESFLAQATTAIWNASLYSSVRRSQEQLQQIVDHSPAAISLKDRDGRFLLTNRRWRELNLDRPTADPIGRTDADLFPPSRAEGTRERDLVVLETGQAIEAEITLQVGGERRTFLAQKFPLVDPAGQPYAVCSISTDITERKRWEDEIAAALAAQRAANEQLARLNAAKSDFLSIVSHEFRSPLTAIQGFSELMRDEVTSIAEMREYAGDVNREAERLTRMINELLDLDQMESGRMRLHVVPLDLGELVTRLVASAAPRAPHHQLRADVPPGLPMLAGDRDRLTQVIVNLLDNALKYSPDGGPVVVGVRAEGDQAHVWVRDDGLGIPPDLLESIFERYARVESEAHRAIRGTGLGLPIVRQIVELHGGRVWVESILGVGSTFHVTLPLGGPPTATP